MERITKRFGLAPHCVATVAILWNEFRGWFGVSFTDRMTGSNFRWRMASVYNRSVRGRGHRRTAPVPGDRQNASSCQPRAVRFVRKRWLWRRGWVGVGTSMNKAVVDGLADAPPLINPTKYSTCSWCVRRAESWLARFGVRVCYPNWLAAAVDCSRFSTPQQAWETVHEPGRKADQSNNRNFAIILEFPGNRCVAVVSGRRCS